jgi:hypothetical protein
MTVARARGGVRLQLREELGVVDTATAPVA